MRLHPLRQYQRKLPGCSLKKNRVGAALVVGLALRTTSATASTVAIPSHAKKPLMARKRNIPHAASRTVVTREVRHILRNNTLPYYKPTPARYQTMPIPRPLN